MKLLTVNFAFAEDIHDEIKEMLDKGVIIHEKSKNFALNIVEIIFLYLKNVNGKMRKKK